MTDPREAYQTSTRVARSQRVLELLRGHWTIERQIEPGGHFDGVAIFSQLSANSLLYRERGRLMLADGTALSGENSYVYTFGNGSIEISFANGLSKGAHFINIFVPDDHPDDLPIVSADRHHCRLDTYDATFRIESRILFTVTYIVSGPTKAYVSRSVYRRLERCE